MIRLCLQLSVPHFQTGHQCMVAGRPCHAQARPGSDLLAATLMQQFGGMQHTEWTAPEGAAPVLVCGCQEQRWRLQWPFLGRHDRQRAGSGLRPTPSTRACACERPGLNPPQRSCRCGHLCGADQLCGLGGWRL